MENLNINEVKSPSLSPPCPCGGEWGSTLIGALVRKGFHTIFMMCLLTLSAGRDKSISEANEFPRKCAVEKFSRLANVLVMWFEVVEAFLYLNS